MIGILMLDMINLNVPGLNRIPRNSIKRVAKVVSDNGLDAEVKKEQDILEIVKYNIMSLQAVVVDGEVVIKGYVPTEEEIKKTLKIWKD